MAARQWRSFLMVELVIYLLIGAWLVDYDRSAVQAVGTVTIVFLALRAAALAVTYGFVFVFSDPVPHGLRIGLFRFLRMILDEYVAMVMLFSVIQPFERFWLKPDRPKPTPDRPPLLLIHGYQCNRGAWFRLLPRLEAAGWSVATHNLEPVLADIDTYADGIARRIDEVLSATGARQVILVGHSMGGLAARAYLRRYGDAKVFRLLSLATPHRGSRLAVLAAGPNGRQMRIGSPWMVALEEVQVPAGSAAIYSVHDNHVMPQQRCSELVGARNIPISGVGHLAMLLARRPQQALLAELATAITGGSPASSG